MPEAGFALVEVIVTALMVALIALLLVGVIAAGQTTGDQRNHSEADQLAQQDQERLRGMSLEQLASLTPSTVNRVVDGETYHVTSSGHFVSASNNGLSGGNDVNSCQTTNGTADYVAIRSTVTWDGMLRANAPVTEESVVAPPAGGTLLTRVYDPAAAPLTGVRVTASPASSTASGTHIATTDSSGCTIFPSLAIGDYTVSASRSGYVDKDGDSTPSTTATATTAGTATSSFTMGQAGSLTASFVTKVGSTTYPSQVAPSIAYNNAQMATPGIASASSGSATSIATPANLFPFSSGTNYTNNYGVWAGKCGGTTYPNQPPTTANIANATVNPGGTGTATVMLPPVVLKTFYKQGSWWSTSTTADKPDDILIYNGCDASFSSYESWSEPVRSDATTNSLGALALPGLPYGKNFVVCVDDNGYRAYAGPLQNTIYSPSSAGNATNWSVTIDSTSWSNRGTC